MLVDRLTARVLELPLWAAVSATVGASVALSMGVTFLIQRRMGRPLVPFVFPVAAVIPALVATPLSALIFSLAHRLEAARLEAQLAADTDVLTGLLNRRRFVEAATAALADAAGGNEPVSLLLMDLDDFKGINDRHGHDAGDAILERAATLCAATLRSRDTFARWGGEEFIALLPGTGARAAMETAHRIHASLASDVLVMNGASIRVTASIGVAERNNPAEPLRTLIARADRAMYEAKRAGKNAAASA